MASSSTGVDMAEKVENLSLDLLRDTSCQTRSCLRRDWVKELAQKLKDGEELDPAVVYFNGTTHHLAAGRHRLEAHDMASRTEMPCIVRNGTRWDAIAFGLADNLRHRGAPLRRRDKQHAIQLVLREKRELSNEIIAEMVGVSPTTVSSQRAKLEATLQIGECNQRLGRDGSYYTVPKRPGTAPPVPEFALYQSVWGDNGLEYGDAGSMCVDIYHQLHDRYLLLFLSSFPTPPVARLVPATDEAVQQAMLDMGFRMEGGWDVCEFDPMYYSEHYNTAHWWCPRLKPIHEDPVFGAPVLEFADRVGRPPMSGDDSFWEAVDQCIDQATESCGELVVLGRDWREPTGELKRQTELWHSRLRELWSAKSRELWPAQARDPRVVDVHQLWGE